MSEQNNNEGGENKWRDKYLDTVDHQEKQEKQFKAQQKLLQRAMLRVSLAAEGQYAELDVALESLREHLRSDELVDITKDLTRLDEILKRFEDDREQGSQEAREALEQIIAPLLARDIPRDTKKQLNDFTREYARQREQIESYPEVLKHIARLQNLVLTELAEPHEKSSGGLFAGLFGGADQAEKPETETAAEDNDNTQSHEPAAPVKSDRALFELNPNAAVKDSQTVSAQLRSIINGLMQSVEAQAVSPERVQAIQAKLKKGITNADLIPVLDEVCQLVMAAYVAATGAFVSYLNSVNQELVDIFKAVGGAESREEAYKDASAVMQNNMMEQFLGLESETAAASDLTELKSQVQSRIDHIRLALEQYQHAITPDDEAMQLSELSERIKVMEAEAAKNQKMLQQQRFKAMHDPLTKLPNREAFNERIALESKRWKRYGNPLTLAICDLDHFKKINDTLGHQAGDRVLQVISQAVGKRLRDVDFFGRYGGEEFIVILPDTAAEDAVTVLDKLRAAIAKTDFSYKETPVSISMSIGVSEFRDEDTISAVVQRADAALYVAKDSGRNQCKLG